MKGVNLIDSSSVSSEVMKLNELLKTITVFKGEEVIIINESDISAYKSKGYNAEKSAKPDQSNNAETVKTVAK